MTAAPRARRCLSAWPVDGKPTWSGVRLWQVVRATHLSDCINNTPTTVPMMYMAQAERLRWVLVEWNMKYSPRSAIPKLLAVASFAT
jgi:hypothetical protein